MPSEEYEALVALLRSRADARGPDERDLAARRAEIDLFESLVPIPDGVGVTDVDMGGVPAVRYRPTGARDGGAVLYLHGGGYCRGSVRSHGALAARLAVASGTPVFLPDYRLAPEHPFPAAVRDTLDAYRWLVGPGGVPATSVVLAGDSAGGGLALSMLIALRDAGECLPAAAVLFSPLTDLAATGDSIIANDRADVMFFGAWVGAVARHYLGVASAADTLASPVYADLSGLPPLLIHVGGDEVLLDDSVRVDASARRSGVVSILEIWRGVPHGWQIFAPFLPEARASLCQAAAFIHQQLSV